MKRRAVLGAGAFTVVGGGVVGTALGYGPLASDQSSSPDYLGEARTSYERENLRVRARPDVVRSGGTVAFEITNTSQSENVQLGCDIPWTIQTYEDGEWNHAVWTGGRYYNMCATQIAPGDSITVEVPLSRSELDGRRGLGDVDFEFTPGTYRFVLIGSRPYLAVNFTVLPPG